MSMKTAYICLLATSLAFLANAANAATFKCDAVDNLARLGYDGSDKVAIIGKDKECKFSIAGASADGISPAFDSEASQADRQMLTQSPQDFIATRLKPIILEAATAFGDTTDFVRDLTTDSDLSNLSCDNESVSVGRLRIRCQRINEISPKVGSSFENGIITALLFRPTFVFEILDTQTNATALVIFIPFLLE
jgi:hypothetical protein